MSKEEKFQKTINKLCKKLAKDQIEILQNSLSNFKWPYEAKEILQNRIEELKQR